MKNRKPGPSNALTVVLLLLLAGCGGSGDEDGGASVATSSLPVQQQAAVTAQGTDPADPASEAPAVARVPGEVVWAALQTSISPDPLPREPFTNYRKVYTADRYFIHLGGQPNLMESHSFTTSPWGSLMRESLLSVTVTGSDGVIDTVSANGVMMVGPQLDLRKVDPAVDATAGMWTNGESYAKLIIQSEASADLMRVCWNVHLPPPPPVVGPPGTQPIVYTVPLKRLTCGVYSRTNPGPDVGGYVVDDFNGQIRTFSGSWQD